MSTNVSFSMVLYSFNVCQYSYAQTTFLFKFSFISRPKLPANSSRLSKTNILTFSLILLMQEKKALKEDKSKQEEKYMWAVVDGIKEKVSSICSSFKFSQVLAVGVMLY